MDVKKLESTAKQIVANGKGILAADESTTTIGKRFQKIGTENTEENRRAYREMLLLTPGAEQWIGGVILYEETLGQKAKDGTPFPDLLAKRGIVPGIKVDKGAKPLAGFPNETITEGLDGLRERLAAFHAAGARFTKWRAVIDVGPGIPTTGAIEANAEALARYAALAQEAGMVPIVEPEVLMDGDHGVERCYEVTETTLRAVFGRLAAHRVALEGILLKPNMVVPGLKSPKQATPDEVADWTLRCFRRNVPAAVPGIVFLSGGMSDEAATANLDAMNRRGGNPWPLSFSYGRALQAAALSAWAGKAANVEAARKAYAHRARMNALAATGNWTRAAESGKA